MHRTQYDAARWMLARDLLRSYAGGPRIWDATELQPRVDALHELGLIEPEGSGHLYRITEAGRKILQEKASDPARPTDV